MSGFFHGIRTLENGTKLKPPVSTGNLTVVVGTAPVNLAKDPKINKPVLLYTLAEAYEYVGYCDDIENYTICEAIKVFFELYGVGPLCVINVLDPSVHKTVKTQELTIDKLNKRIKMEFGVKSETLKIKKGTDILESGVDYIASFDSNGYMTINFIKGGKVLASDGTWSVEKLSFEYEIIDPTAVTKADIIGGYDSEKNIYEGLELINQCFIMYRKVPTLLLSPKFGEDSAVAAVLDTKANKICTVFKAMSIIDIPETVVKYSEVPNVKNQSNIVSPTQIVCWPKVKLGDYVYRLSTQIAGLMVYVDYLNKDIPKESPSNKNLKIDGVGTGKKGQFVPLNLDLDQANFLNENGIMTVLNFINGFTAWGNYTACYPNNTDTKDAMIPAKRLVQHYDNSFILDNWSKLDKNTDKKLIGSIVDTRNELYNGEVTAGNILSGKIEFVESENPKLDLLSGKLGFKNYITPPLPAQEIISTIELDPSGYSKLF